MCALNLDSRRQLETLESPLCKVKTVSIHSSDSSEPAREQLRNDDSPIPGSSGRLCIFGHQNLPSVGNCSTCGTSAFLRSQSPRDRQLEINRAHAVQEQPLKRKKTGFLTQLVGFGGIVEFVHAYFSGQP